MTLNCRNPVARSVGGKKSSKIVCEGRPRNSVRPFRDMRANPSALLNRSVVEALTFTELLPVCSSLGPEFTIKPVEFQLFLRRENFVKKKSRFPKDSPPIS